MASASQSSHFSISAFKSGQLSKSCTLKMLIEPLLQGAKLQGAKLQGVKAVTTEALTMRMLASASSADFSSPIKSGHVRASCTAERTLEKGKAEQGLHSFVRTTTMLKECLTSALETWPWLS